MTDEAYRHMRALMELYRAAVTRPAWVTWGIVLDITEKALTPEQQKVALEVIQFS